MCKSAAAGVHQLSKVVMDPPASRAFAARRDANVTSPRARLATSHDWRTVKKFLSPDVTRPPPGGHDPTSGPQEARRRLCAAMPC